MRRRAGAGRCLDIHGVGEPNDPIGVGLSSCLPTAQGARGSLRSIAARLDAPRDAAASGAPRQTSYCACLTQWSPGLEQVQLLAPQFTSLGAFQS